MRYRYFTCDVFTDTRFGGNQLAILPEAGGLSSAQMQQIAREFNFSESTFVLPAESGHTRKVRIFTPTSEIPFAGHPNIGTAFALAATGAFGPVEEGIVVTFEEEAGPVPISIRKDHRIWCELRAPESLSIGATVTPEAAANALGLDAADILVETHPPQVASVGLPFIMVELKDRSALARARADMSQLDSFAAAGITPDIHLYVRSRDEFDIRARMFAPLDGVPEDPATGSANCALAGLLAHYDQAVTGHFGWHMGQGVEMGRPSVLDARAEKRAGTVEGTWIGGDCVMVSEGMIEVG